MVLIATGWDVPGTTATFVPFRKKAKTSLKVPLENSLYSSEPKTYWKEIVEDVVVKSNLRIAASAVELPLASACSAGSRDVPFNRLVASERFGPGRELAAPVLRGRPLSKPTLVAPPVNVPAAAGAPM